MWQPGEFEQLLGKGPGLGARSFDGGRKGYAPPGYFAADTADYWPSGPRIPELQGFLKPVEGGVSLLFGRSLWAHLAGFLLLPWAVFTLVLASFAFGYAQLHGLAWLVFAVFVLASAALIWKSVARRTDGTPRLYWRWLGVSCLSLTLLGMFAGLLIYDRYTRVYELFETSRWYKNVLVSANPGALQDAGTISFSSDAYVDISRSVGHQAGKTYCAAPIVSSAGLANATAGSAFPSIGYWAVGADCCKARGSFSCGPVDDEQAHGGVVVFDGLVEEHRVFQRYRAAVQQAGVVYRLHVPEDAVLLRWTRSPSEVHGSYLESAAGLFRDLVISMIFVMPVCASLLVYCYQGAL